MPRNSRRDFALASWKISVLMRLLTPICAFSLVLGLAAAMAAEPKGETKPESKAEKKSDATQKSTGSTNEVAVMKTSMGTMVFEFWPDVAPKTVANFKKLAREGFYDGTAFHRIIKGFMVQGGDPNTKDLAKEESYGTGGPGYHIPAEFNERSHQFGVLSMARSRDPNSAGSQFFICNGDASQLDRQYTAFGKLIKGDDVLKAISDTPVTPNPMSGEPSKPTKRITIESLKIVPANQAK
jgi:peptidyl-prolyl cis-trans isomerase B (cyclophilin B)